MSYFDSLRKLLVQDIKLYRTQGGKRNPINYKDLGNREKQILKEFERLEEQKANKVQFPRGVYDYDDRANPFAYDKPRDAFWSQTFNRYPSHPWIKAGSKPPKPDSSHKSQIQAFEERAVVIISNPGYLLDTGGTEYVLTAPILQDRKFTVNGEDLELCKRELFRSEQTISGKPRGPKDMKWTAASGFLLKQDIVVTSGHILSGQFADPDIKQTLKNMRVITNFKFPAPGTAERKAFDLHGVLTIPKTNVFEVSKEIHKNNSIEDWALLRLSRDAKLRANKLPNWTKFPPKKEINADIDIYMLGFPLGLPLKLTHSAYVRKKKTAQFLLTNLDAYRGNSGSAVFDAKSHELIGILTAGEKALTKRKNQNCATTRERKLRFQFEPLSSGEGELVQIFETIHKQIKNLPPR